MKVLVTAASKYGATGGIAQAIGNVLAEYGFDTKVMPPEAVGTIEAYDAIVLGSAVYAGHWLEPAKELVRRSRDAFAGRPVWLFSSGPVGDPQRNMVQKMGEEPVDVAEIRETTKARDHRVFEGKIDRKNLSFPERALLLAFRGLEGDFRDWSEIKQWASDIAKALQSRGGG
jgi:menaquinone-dependent protoporphyrinogen oxidase